MKSLGKQNIVSHTDPVLGGRPTHLSSCPLVYLHICHRSQSASGKTEGQSHSYFTAFYGYQDL